MSSRSKAFSSNGFSSEFAEESGWTTYFQDFFNGGDKDSTTSSLISDAASLAATKKLADDKFSGNKNCKRLSSKKRKKEVVATMVDDALEDTASSPLNSPKGFICEPVRQANKEGRSTRFSGERE